MVIQAKVYAHHLVYILSYHLSKSTISIHNNSQKAKKKVRERKKHKETPTAIIISPFLFTTLCLLHFYIFASFISPFLFCNTPFSLYTHQIIHSSSSSRERSSSNTARRSRRKGSFRCSVV